MKLIAFVFAASLSLASAFGVVPSGYAVEGDGQQFAGIQQFAGYQEPASNQHITDSQQLAGRQQFTDNQQLAAASFSQTLAALSQDAAALSEELQLLAAQSQGGAMGQSPSGATFLPQQALQQQALQQQALQQQAIEQQAAALAATYGPPGAEAYAQPQQPQLQMQPQMTTAQDKSMPQSPPQSMPQSPPQNVPQSPPQPRHIGRNAAMSLTQVMTQNGLSMGAPGLVAAQNAVAREVSAGAPTATAAYKSAETLGLLQLADEVAGKGIGPGQCGQEGELKCASFNKFRSLNYRLTTLGSQAAFWGIAGLSLATAFACCCCCIREIVHTIVFFAVLALVLGVASYALILH